MTTLTIEPGALVALHAELNRIRAADAELKLRIRSGEAVAIHSLRSVTVSRALRFRDLVTAGGARHGAQLASAHGGFAPSVLATALDRFGRALLTDLSRGTLRAKFEAEIRRQLPAAWPVER
jgi:hypothetical protein